MSVEMLRLRLPSALVQELRKEARRRGLTLAALIRERLAAWGGNESVYARSSDLAGCLAGARRSATNARHRFHGRRA